MTTPLLREAAAALTLCCLALPAKADPSFGPYPEQTYMTCGNPNATTAVALMHGGWDIGGGYNDNWNIQQSCKALKNFAVYAFNYRLARTPGQGWPSQWQDAQLMVRWLRSQGYSKVGFMGISAGAYNALGITFSQGTIQWKPTDPQNEAALYPGVSSLPDFTVAVSPFSDLSAPGLSPMAVRMISSGVAHGGMDAQTAMAIASPITRIHPDIPPLLVIHGNNDPMVPVEQSIMLNREMMAIGGNMKFMLTGGKHVFGGYAPGPLDRLLGEIGDWAGEQ